MCVCLFAFLAKVDHYLSAWQVKKKTVRGNILVANVLKSIFSKRIIILFTMINY